MAGPEKRLPGQSDADYARTSDPNANFHHTRSLHGGGDLTFGVRLMNAILARRRRRQRRGPSRLG